MNQIAKEIIEYIDNNIRLVKITNTNILDIQAPFRFYLTNEPNQIGSYKILKSWELNDKNELAKLLSIIQNRIIDLLNQDFSYLKDNEKIYFLILGL